jgi:threonine dehydratase
MDASRVRQAAGRIAGRVHRTPVLGSATLEALTGAKLAIKNEAFQKTGSFKARGALNRVLTTPPDALARGLIGVSAGNHAAALAWAGSAAGARVTVVMPATANPRKVAACRGYGAEVVLHGDTTTEAFEEGERLRRERGLELVHPFDDPEIVAGQGTAGLELAEDAGPFDVLVVCVGGGGLCTGMATAVRDLFPACRVIGVEPEGAASLTAALAAGHPVPIPPRSIADGLCAPHAGPYTFPLLRELVDEVVTVSEAELLDGTRFVMERLKVVAEPAGAAAVAAMVAGKVPGLAGARAGTIISGGNADLGALGAAFAAAGA